MANKSSILKRLKRMPTLLYQISIILKQNFIILFAHSETMFLLNGVVKIQNKNIYKYSKIYINLNLKIYYFVILFNGISGSN